MRLTKVVVNGLDAAETVRMYCDGDSDWDSVYAAMYCRCLCDKIITNGYSPGEELWIVFVVFECVSCEYEACA